MAQLGSALRSGRRGRGFESRHPDTDRRRWTRSIHSSGSIFSCAAVTYCESTLPEPANGLPEVVFAALSEHENLGPLFLAKIRRVKDGDTSRNGVGSIRSLKLGPLPAFEETTITSEPHSLIEYRITKGGPLRGHWGVQKFTPTDDGGTELDYTIGFDAPVPGLAAIVGKALTSSISKNLSTLAQ